jgi:uncharacterized protein YyaL (SSP411 family)
MGLASIGGSMTTATIPRHTNRLIHETSPYLLQHAHNPVYWYPWGEEAFAAARAENKAILLSIGYSACHWCHVMERESFEDEAIAALMNRHFVNIKVDREERPDLDQIYQSAFQVFNRRGGGWPLTMFLTPDGKPFTRAPISRPTIDTGCRGSLVLETVASAYREKAATSRTRRAGRRHPGQDRSVEPSDAPPGREAMRRRWNRSRAFSSPSTAGSAAALFPARWRGPLRAARAGERRSGHCAAPRSRCG